MVSCCPIYDIEPITTYADDNYLGSENPNFMLAISEIKRKIISVTNWLTGSGMKINDQKTEICIFTTVQIYFYEREDLQTKIAAKFPSKTFFAARLLFFSEQTPLLHCFNLSPSSFQVPDLASYTF